MGRKPDVWRRGDKGAWYAWVDGKKTWIAAATATKTEARQAHRAVLSRTAGATVRVEALTVADVCSLRLDAIRGDVKAGHASEKWLELNWTYLSRFGADIGTVLADRITTAAVTAWVLKHEAWSQGTRVTVRQLVKATFRWAWQHGHLTSNPLAHFKAGSAPSRAKVVLPDEARALLGDVPPGPLRDVLDAIRLTGCRTGEVYGLTADRVDLERSTWHVLNKTRGKTGVEYRRVVLSPAAVALTRRKLTEHPEGFVFRTEGGKQWRDDNVNKHLRTLAKKHGWNRKFSPIELRHLFARDAVAVGVPAEVVAALMGHVDPKMVQRVYGRIDDRDDLLRDAAGKVRPE